MELEGLVVNGRYEVARRLQSGYFGTTWLARDSRLREDVCLKTFFSDSPAQRKELAVLRELCVGHFSHDNLCRVLDTSLETAPVTNIRDEVVLNLRYVVFEYCSGSDLFNFLVTGPFEKTKRVSSFPEPLARHYFTQALLAVVYLHERGVFHRDIKPENCVLDQDFNLKLTDFGTNKILPISEAPTQVLRTATKGIGTDSYRAPEVNGLHGYDPAAADVWSLGVTLFFLVGIEAMVERVGSLDPYSRSVLAPLGILFPFPLFCCKLDSYLRGEQEVAGTIRANGGRPLPNDQFWAEWPQLTSLLSPQLQQLFNGIFTLSPTLRLTLRDLARHPWVSMATKLSAEGIREQMEARCPSSIHPSLSASPRVVGQKLLGGVDQTTLRLSLSRSGQDEVAEYLTDAELWVMTDAIRRLEALQLDIVSSNDIQELIMDVNESRQMLGRILSSPDRLPLRTVPVRAIHSAWVGQLLLVLGYLPQGDSLFLSADRMDLHLLQRAISVLEGVEVAVSRSAVPVASSEEEDHMITDQSEFMEGRVTLQIPSDPSAYSSDSSRSAPHPSPLTPTSLPFRPPPLYLIGKSSSDPELPPLRGGVVMATSPPGSALADSPLFVNDSSQDSATWTQYTLSSQSSQEECPEAMVEDWSHDHSAAHHLLELATSVNLREPNQYRAAAEFCKLSGLLCSYGLYQVVCNDQLALYCRGNAASFSARVVALDLLGKIGISSWCFQGNEEWQAILQRVGKDMTPQKTRL